MSDKTEKEGIFFFSSVQVDNESIEIKDCKANVELCLLMKFCVIRIELKAKR